LTSNVRKGFKVPGGFANHPVKQFYEAGKEEQPLASGKKRVHYAPGLPFSLSCDNLLLSGEVHSIPTPTGEIVRLVTPQLVLCQISL